MAQIIIEDPEAMSRSLVLWGRTIALGVVVGLISWLLTGLISHYVVEPIVCGQGINAAACSDATALAGKIATVLVATLAIAVMVRMSVARPIIVAIATAALLWNLADWTLGLFWLEAIAWSVLLYALCFALFAWITRYATLWVTLIGSLLIVLVIRILLAL